MATLTPSTWHSGSVGLKRAGDPNALSRVAGLGFAATAPAGSWPTLGIHGGVLAPVPQRMGSISQEGLNPDILTTTMARTIGLSTLGTISVPGQSVPSITETSDWGKVVLAYSGQFDLTLSRLTPAILVEAAKTSLRFCSGTTTKRVTSGTLITSTAAQTILPKWVGWHESDGYHTAQLASGPIDLTDMDQPWILVWWGAGSHWCDTTIPLTHADVIDSLGSTRGLPHRYAFQADCPMLLTFGTEPDAISQDASGGFDLAWGSASDIVSILPLYGRRRLMAGTTETWGTAIPSDVQSRIQAWYPRTLEFPDTVAETYAYNSGTDVTTITEAFTWTQVHAGGTKFAAIPPSIGIAYDSNLAVTCSETIVDGDMPTEWGPLLGCEGVDGYDLDVAGVSTVDGVVGLDEYVAPRVAPGGGTIPAGLQARIDDEVDKLVAQSHWEPWGIPNRAPNPNPGGDVYYSDPADTVLQAAEVYPMASASQQAALASWLETEITTTTPLSTFKQTATTGEPRGLFGLEGSAHSYWNSTQTSVFLARRDIWVAYAMARYYQETGASIPAGTTNSLITILQADMAEHAWDLGLWLQGYGPRQTGIENANRLLAGLIGLAWIGSQQAPTDAADLVVVRGLIARVACTRIAMLTYTRYLTAAGLLTFPTDRGSALANAAWLPEIGTAGWNGYTVTYNWAADTDDPRVVVKWDQYHCWLDTSACRMGWPEGALRAYLPAARSLTYNVARLLEAASPGELAIDGRKRREARPHEWLPFANAHYGQEQGYAMPADSYGSTLVRAWGETNDPHVLEVEAGYPWLVNGGDLMTLHKLAEAARSYAGEAPPRITAITANATTLDVGQKLELTFMVASDATRPDEVYDSAANIPNYDTTKGINVLVTLTHVPTGDTFVERGFHYGAYTRQQFGARDWISPDEANQESTGQYRFGFRATLPTAGVWTTSISVEDADNDGDPEIAIGPNITAVDAPWAGMVRVSPTDSRYFEREDGTYLPGFGTHYTNFSRVNPIVGNQYIAEAGTYNIEFLRIWLSAMGAFGAYNHPWRAYLGGGNAFLSAMTAPASGGYDDHELAFVMTQNVAQTAVATLSWDGCCVKPTTTYRVDARIKCEGTFTPTNGADPYGFTFKASNFFINAPWLTASAPTSRLMTPVHDTGGAWQTVTATWVTGTNRFPVFYMTLENCDAGTVYVDSITVREDLGAGNYGPNVVPKPTANMHSYVSQDLAWRFDKVVELAEGADASMIVVLADKEDAAIGCWDETTGLPETPSVNNAYGAVDASMTKARWLQMSWWAYARARWGYSPSIHSWQPFNEGDPTLGRHFLLVRDCAAFMHADGEANPPVNTHMATASFWSQVYPKSNFWNSGSYNTNLDFVNFHKYLPPLDELMTVTGGSNFTVTDDARYDTVLAYLTLADQIGAGGSQAVSSKPAMLAETALTSTGDTNSAANLSADTAHIWLHKMCWVQLHSKVMHVNWFNTTLQLLTPERRQVIRRYVEFARSLPLNNGHYVDAAATGPTGLRIVGQKDVTNDRLHLWIDNQEHTHGTVIAGTTPTPRTGEIIIDGLTVGVYAVTWTDPYTGSVTLSESVATDGAGTLTLFLTTPLSTDIAVHAALLFEGGLEIMGLGLTDRNGLVGYQFGNRAYTPPTTYYLALVTDASNPDPSLWPEVSTSSWSNYAREAMTNDATTFTAPVDGHVSNDVVIDFGAATIVGPQPTIKGFVLRDAAVAGTVRASQVIPEANWRTVSNADPVYVEVGNLDLTLEP